MDSQQFEQIKNLLDLCFDVKDYVKGFPQIYENLSERDILKKTVGGKIVSFCAFNELNFKLGEQPIRAFCIGSVCTHPDFRGKGYAEEVMTLAAEEAEKRKVDVILLFSNVEDFYHKLGFETCGGDVLFKFDIDDAAEVVLKHTKSLRSEKGIIDRIMLLEKGPAKLSLEQKKSLWNFICQVSGPGESELPFEEFELILKTNDMSVAYSQKDEQIYACGFFGKGHDFKDVLHGLYFKDYREALWFLQTFSLSQGLPAYFVFPGAHAAAFEKWFEYSQNPTLMIKTLHSHSKLLKAFKKKKLYVRSLQST